MAKKDVILLSLVADACAAAAQWTYLVPALGRLGTDAANKTRGKTGRDPGGSLKLS